MAHVLRLGSFYFGPRAAAPREPGGEVIIRDGGAEEEEGQAPPPFVFSWRRLLQHLGPGFLMAIAFIVPGNLEADLQTGASTGYSLLWVLLWSTIMVSPA